MLNGKFVIGSKLLKIAERIAIKKFYNGIVVISGEGVKTYYGKRGYQEIDTYMVKSFAIYRFLILLGFMGFMGFMGFIIKGCLPL